MRPVITNETVSGWHFTDNRPDFILEIYLVYDWQEDVSNCSPDEHAELGWFTVGEASKLSLADERYKSIFALAFADKI